MFGCLCGKALTFWMEYDSKNDSALTFTSYFICAPEKRQNMNMRQLLQRGSGNKKMKDAENKPSFLTEGRLIVMFSNHWFQPHKPRWITSPRESLGEME